jgi:protein TonB
MRHLPMLAAAFVCLAMPILAAQEDTTIYSPGNGVTLPSVVTQVRPEYTAEARAQRIEGVVGLTCVVRPDGSVTDIVVTDSLDSVFGLDRQAADALAKWVFKPGTKGGKPVAVRVDIRMNFTLR